MENHISGTFIIPPILCILVIKHVEFQIWLVEIFSTFICFFNSLSSQQWPMKSLTIFFQMKEIHKQSLTKDQRMQSGDCFTNVFKDFMEAGATNTAVALCTLEYIRCDDSEWFPFDFSIAVLLIICLSFLLVLFQDVMLNCPHRTKQTRYHVIV